MITFVFFYIYFLKQRALKAEASVSKMKDEIKFLRVGLYQSFFSVIGLTLFGLCNSYLYCQAVFMQEFDIVGCWPDERKSFQNNWNKKESL